MTTPRPIWGGLRHEDVADLQLAKGAEDELADFERPVVEVVDSVLGADTDRLSLFRQEIEQHRTTNAPRFADFKERSATRSAGSAGSPRPGSSHSDWRSSCSSSRPR